MDTSTYIAYYFEVEPQIPGVEILIAELGYVGFESFVETPKGVTAYIQKNEFLSTMLEDIQILKTIHFQFNTSSKTSSKSIGMPNGKKIFIPFWSITVVQFELLFIVKVLHNMISS